MDVDALGTEQIEVLKLKFPILEYFAYAHLPEKLQAVSAPIGRLAFQMADLLPHNAETSAGLRKLLEAKDCLVRAAIHKS